MSMTESLDAEDPFSGIQDGGEEIIVNSGNIPVQRNKLAN